MLKGVEMCRTVKNKKKNQIMCGEVEVDPGGIRRVLKRSSGYV